MTDLRCEQQFASAISQTAAAIAILFTIPTNTRMLDLARIVTLYITYCMNNAWQRSLFRQHLVVGGEFEYTVFNSCRACNKISIVSYSTLAVPAIRFQLYSFETLIRLSIFLSHTHF